MDNDTTVLANYFIHKCRKKISEGIDDLQVPKTYEKPLNCVIFLDVYFDD